MEKTPIPISFNFDSRSNLYFDENSKVLEEHRNTCEREGKYVEAEMAKNRITELKQQDYDRRY